LQSHGARGGLRVSHRRLGLRGIGWVDEHRDAGRCGHQLAQDVQVLGDKFAREKIVPCDIAARPGEARNQTEPDRIFANTEDDGDGRGCSLGGQRRNGAAHREDHGDWPAGKFARQYWQTVELVLGPTVFDHDVLAFDITAFLQTCSKPTQPLSGSIGRQRMHEADHRHCCLLRASSQRQRCRTAQSCDEFPTPHDRHQGSGAIRVAGQIAALKGPPSVPASRS
jgi:hypothetical protein